MSVPTRWPFVFFEARNVNIGGEVWDGEVAFDGEAHVLDRHAGGEVAIVAQVAPGVAHAGEVGNDDEVQVAGSIKDFLDIIHVGGAGLGDAVGVVLGQQNVRAAGILGELEHVDELGGVGGGSAVAAGVVPFLGRIGGESSGGE